jgi:DNA-binding XRE family transcriptional regulator
VPRWGGDNCSAQEQFFWPHLLNNFLLNGAPVKNLLKLKRWEAGMKQYELANRLGCSASYLSMVENGRLEPPEEFKEKVAATLNLNVDDLFPAGKPNSKSVFANYFIS